MRIRHHYCLEDKFGLVKFLDKFQIPYEVLEIPESEYKTFAFQIYEDQEVYARFKAQFPIASRWNAFQTIEYSTAEIENAEWLFVRNMGIKVQWEYDEHAFQESCPYKRLFIKETYYRHSEQKDLLSVTKPVRWGTRQFFSGPNAADNILFCSEKAKCLLENRWAGLEFWPVKKYNASSYMKDLYQLFFSKILPIEALGGGQAATCKGCGRKIIRIPKGIHQLTIDGNFLQDKKRVYRTENGLTDEWFGCSTFSLNLVPQEFYQYCEANGMNRSMVYEPVRLV